MAKVYGEAQRRIRICVDACDQGVISGRYVPPGQTESRPFHSLVQLIVETERCLDEANFPQSYTAKRTFSPLPEFQVSGTGPGGSGQLATFDIRLLFRQHASWQGTVSWVEGHSEESFRSVLELILLLDSALSGP
jgi:hypothetical protein